MKDMPVTFTIPVRKCGEIPETAKTEYRTTRTWGRSSWYAIMVARPSQYTYNRLSGVYRFQSCDQCHWTYEP